MEGAVGHASIGSPHGLWWNETHTPQYDAPLGDGSGSGWQRTGRLPMSRTRPRTWFGSAGAQVVDTQEFSSVPLGTQNLLILSQRAWAAIW